jgi:hypothetical protein
VVHSPTGRYFTSPDLKERTDRHRAPTTSVADAPILVPLWNGGAVPLPGHGNPARVFRWSLHMEENRIVKSGLLSSVAIGRLSLNLRCKILQPPKVSTGSF